MAHFYTPECTVLLAAVFPGCEAQGGGASVSRPEGPYRAWRAWLLLTEAASAECAKKHVPELQFFDIFANDVSDVF